MQAPSSQQPNIDNNQAVSRQAASGLPARTNQPEVPEISTLGVLARLLLGSAVLGSEELNRRFKRRQQEFRSRDVVRTIVIPPESEGVRLRHALIGAISAGAQAVNKGLTSLAHSTNAAHGLITQATRPVTDNRLMGPARRRFETLEARGESVVEGWIRTGQREETISRDFVQQTSTEAIEELLDYLAKSPEMDQLVEQQGVDLAGNLVEEIQERTTLSIIFKRWFAIFSFKQPPPGTPPGSSSQTPLDTPNPPKES